jgi:hypothetical protein
MSVSNTLNSLSIKPFTLSHLSPPSPQPKAGIGILFKFCSSIFCFNAFNPAAIYSYFEASFQCTLVGKLIMVIPSLSKTTITLPVFNVPFSQVCLYTL